MNRVPETRSAYAGNWVKLARMTEGPLTQVLDDLELATRGRGLVDITPSVAEWCARQGIGKGLLTVFLPHTSASLLLQEHADPQVARDLEAWLDRAVPDGDPLFRHVAEGPDDMPAHVRAALTQSHVAIPVSSHRLQLGTWQGLFLFEHRRRGRPRRIMLHLLGSESAPS